jgi:hypothetical protein
MPLQSPRKYCNKLFLGEITLIRMSCVSKAVEVLIKHWIIHLVVAIIQEISIIY